MVLVGRSRELGLLRSAWDRRDASVIALSGLRGVGKTALVAHATKGLPRALHRAPPLPDPSQRSHLRDTLRVARSRLERGEDAPAEGAGWSELFQSARELARPGEQPFVLVIDDAHRLAQARSRFVEPLLAAIGVARSEHRALHVVLVSPGAGGPAAAELGEAVDERIAIGPLPFRAAATLLPGAKPLDRLRAYGVFGGIPRVLDAVDSSATLGTNIRRLLLDSETGLADAGAYWLERDLQTPPRYYAILTALAEGESDWGRVHAGVSDLTTSGQVAPYLKRLTELDLIAVRRSLDASARGRSRRYRAADPFLAFWFRFVFPYRRTEGKTAANTYLNDVIRADLDRHMDGVFPEICRQYMTYDAMESLGANARESGGLWGTGYDIPVAGMLTSGASYYGRPLWNPPSSTVDVLDRLDAEIRETRYGFGRERRLRIVFTGSPTSPELRREAARRPDAMVVDARALLGEE